MEKGKLVRSLRTMFNIKEGEVLRCKTYSKDGWGIFEKSDLSTIYLHKSEYQVIVT